jgi:hypothetical protein
MKGLVIIGLILTSMVSSSFAFSMQNMDNNQSNYFGGALANSINMQADYSKTGSIVDIHDSNPVDNIVTIYNFSTVNNKISLEKMNEFLKEKVENNSKLDDIEILGFKVTPINSDYFNVKSDENNIVRVTQLQNVGDNEQVRFLSLGLIVHRKSTNENIIIPLSNYLADKNPFVIVDKKIVNLNENTIVSNAHSDCVLAINLIIGAGCLGLSFTGVGLIAAGVCAFFGGAQAVYEWLNINGSADVLCSWLGY